LHIFWRFVVGPSEENDYVKPLLSPQTPQLEKSNQDTIRQAITDIRQAYCTIDSKLKIIWTSDVCPHAYGCLHYILSVSKKIVLKIYIVSLYILFF